MDTLPKNILAKIALELSPVDLISLCSTDKKSKKEICDNNQFWIEKLKRD